MKHNSENNPRDQSKWPLIISAMIITSVLLSYFVIPQVNRFLNEAYDVLTSDNEARISDWVGNLGIWGPLFIIIAMSLQMFLIVVPSPLLIIISILAFGPVWGSVLSIVAVGIASTIGYFIGKYVGKVFINRIIGEKKKKNCPSMSTGTVPGQCS
jgi:uncharacterized membrane protein YdjX (TVP38/TMEM64 family)